MLFHGLSAFPLTPLDAEGRLLPELFAAALERIVAAEVSSIGLLGSTGSYAYMSIEERKRALELACDVVGGRIPLIVSIGAHRSSDAADLARHARSSGASGLLLAPVSYQPLTEDEVFGHFQHVAAAGELPLCIYNNPRTTGFTFSPALIARLSQLPNLAAVKMPPLTGDALVAQMADLRATCAENFAIGYSGDWVAAEALEKGADAWFSVIAGLLPRQAAQLQRAASASNTAEVARLTQAFEPFWVLFREFGSYRLMYALASLIEAQSFNPPLPVLPPNAELRARTAQALAALEAQA